MRYFGMHIPPWTGSQQPSHACDAPARNRINPRRGVARARFLYATFRSERLGRVRVASRVISTPPPVVAVRPPFVSASVDGVQNAAEGVSLMLEPRRPLRPPWDRGKVPRRPRGQLRELGRDRCSWGPGRPRPRWWGDGVMASKDGERSFLERALPALGADRRPPRARSPWCAGEPAPNWGLASWEGRPPKLSRQARRSSSFTLCELWRLRASQRAAEPNPDADGEDLALTIR
jgi:hypothetical protein